MTPDEKEPEYHMGVTVNGKEFTIRVEATGPAWLVRKILQDLDEGIGEVT